MKKKSSHGPNPVDIHVGKRMRMRRTLLGFSQDELGKALGLTFQQIQKYERGSCRIGASRLWDIGRVLKAPVSFFYEGLPETLNGSNSSCQNTAQGSPVLADTTIQIEDDTFNRRETLELVRNYYKITDRNLAKKVADLIKSMAAADEQEQPKI